MAREFPKDLAKLLIWLDQCEGLNRA